MEAVADNPREKNPYQRSSIAHHSIAPPPAKWSYTTDDTIIAKIFECFILNVSTEKKAKNQTSACSNLHQGP